MKSIDSQIEAQRNHFTRAYLLHENRSTTQLSETPAAATTKPLLTPVQFKRAPETVEDEWNLYLSKPQKYGVGKKCDIDKLPNWIEVPSLEPTQEELTLKGEMVEMGLQKKKWPKVYRNYGVPRFKNGRLQTPKLKLADHQLSSPEEPEVEDELPHFLKKTEKVRSLPCLRQTFKV